MRAARRWLSAMILSLLVAACSAGPAAAPTATPVPTAPPTPPTQPNVYRVTNPTSGVRLFVQLFYPPDWNGDPLPTLVLVPGGTAPGDLEKGQRLAADGFTVVVFDPDGRGASLGAEDLDGAIHQDGLAAVIRAAAALPGVDAAQIGLVSYSYGVTMASGALARYPDLPIRFLIDWEGPADRYDTTLDCTVSSRQVVWPDCDDDAAWAQREALTFIARVRVPYQRIQSEEDHVQLDVSHAVAMVNAAIAGGVPWVRLNDYPPGQSYDPAAPPDMLPERMDRNLEMLIAQYAGELFAQ